MQVDPFLQSKADNYKLLTNLVVPRPIAWVSTVSRKGVVNLAPFSFFNAVCADPLYVVVSIGRRDSGAAKDTALNIDTSGEFVVNLVTEELLAAMNISAADFPPDQSELLAAGLLATPSIRITPPRLALAQASLECRLFQSLPLGVNTLFIGEVMMFHVADHLLGPSLHIDHFAPIGRLGSPSIYCRTTDRFDLPRVTYDPSQRQSKMAKIEPLKRDAHRAQITADVKVLVEKYRSIFDWDVLEVDEALSARLILKALRQALDDIEAESSAGRPR